MGVPCKWGVGMRCVYTLFIAGCPEDMEFDLPSGCIKYLAGSTHVEAVVLDDDELNALRDAMGKQVLVGAWKIYPNESSPSRPSLDGVVLPTSRCPECIWLNPENLQSPCGVVSFDKELAFAFFSNLPDARADLMTCPLNTRLSDS
jgi:hypothetical protein